MFDHIRRSARTSVDADRLKSQAAEVGAVLSDASVHAGQAAAQLAEQVAEQAKVGALHAKDWAAPRVEKALREGAKAAAPKVEKAAERAVPLVDSAHDRLVDDLLPKLVAALTAAAGAAAVGADKARDVTSAKLTELAHLEVPEPKKSHKGAKVFWFFAGIAAIGAAVAAWRSSRPTHDPWAEQPWEHESEHGTDRFKARAAEARDELEGVVSDVRHELGDAAEAVGEAAGETVARTREATEKAAERAREATERAREATEKAAERAKDAAKKTTTPRRRTAKAATDDATAASDEVTEAIPTPAELFTEPTDAQKIPTDVPGQPKAPGSTAKGADES
ncbi:hypothetical protein [Actinotalea subterranea]|uniref:hypothetical protein n=1 Tax=Actinotalea subterranea TaxID=2607497 RepID=UPI0011EE21BE|nr:hypothetical protein [Actinotalea subterranea]